MSLVRCPHSLGCIHYVYCRGVEGRRCCLKRQSFLRPPPPPYPPRHTEFVHKPPFPLLTKRKNYTLHFTLSEIQISRKEEMELDSPLPIIQAKLPARTLHQQEKKYKNMNINKLVMHDGSQLTLIVQVYFPFTREW